MAITRSGEIDSRDTTGCEHSGQSVVARLLLLIPSLLLDTLHAVQLLPVLRDVKMRE